MTTRWYGAILGSTVQRVPPTPFERGQLKVDRMEEEDLLFGVRYVVYRHQNLSIAAYVMLLRIIFTAWAAISSIKECVDWTLGCRDGIIETFGPGSTGPNSLPPDLTDEMVADVDACVPYMGVVPSGAFPLIADYMRESMVGYELMAAVKIFIRFLCEVAALLCVWRAYGAWSRYRRSRRLVQFAFGFGMLPPFVLSLSFPMSAGVNLDMLLRRTCGDVTNALLQPEVQPPRWLFNLPLPEPTEFCAMDSAAWGPAIELAMQRGGVVGRYNNVTGAFTCSVAAALRSSCETPSSPCADCFGRVAVPGSDLSPAHPQVCAAPDPPSVARARALVRGPVAPRPRSRRAP